MSQVKWRECNFETEERTSQWQMEIWREKHWETQRQQSSAVLQLPHASAVIGVRCSELQQWSGGIEKSVSAQEVQTVPELPLRCAKFEHGHKQSGRVAEWQSTLRQVQECRDFMDQTRQQSHIWCHFVD